MKRARRSQPFDGDDPVVLVHDRKRKARVDPPAVDEHCASATLPVVATLLGTAQAEILAESVKQCGAQVQLEAVRLTVHSQPNLPRVFAGRRTLDGCHCAAVSMIRAISWERPMNTR